MFSEHSGWNQGHRTQVVGVITPDSPANQPIFCPWRRASTQISVKSDRLPEDFPICCSRQEKVKCGRSGCHQDRPCRIPTYSVDWKVTVTANSPGTVWERLVHSAYTHLKLTAKWTVDLFPNSEKRCAETEQAEPQAMSGAVQRPDMSSCRPRPCTFALWSPQSDAVVG